MNIDITKPEIINLEDFLRICVQEVEVPASEDQIKNMAKIVESVQFRRFDINTKRLLESELYAASDTDKTRETWFRSGDQIDIKNRCMITYRELFTLPNLLKDYLDGLRKERINRPERATPHIITLHCSSCDARWLFDGNHGFVRICASGDHKTIKVTEMSSRNWNGNLRACRCKS